MISLDIIHSITGGSTKKIKYLENGQNPTITFVGHSLVNSPLSFFNFSNISLSKGVMTTLEKGDCTAFAVSEISDKGG